MSLSSRALVELVLLGPANDRRQLQDSPVLGDVWIAYAVKPAEVRKIFLSLHSNRALPLRLLFTSLSVSGS